MGLKVTNTINADFVLSKVDEIQIFTAYFGPFKLRQVYPSIFRKDENPSTGFYVNKAGKLIYNDISTSEKLDCFAFVAKLNNISYGQAVYKVACDFGLMGGEPIVPITQVRRAEFMAESIKEDKRIDIEADKWYPSYLDYWKQFHITQEELERENVIPVKKLWVNDVKIPNYSKEIRFCYELTVDNITYRKIYKPLAEKNKFKWINNIPIHIPFGINKLTYKENRVIVTKAQKDRLILLKYFPDVIATQNESPSSLRDRTISFLDKRYDVKYYNSDIDKAGMSANEYFVGKGFEPLQIPEFLYEKHGIKDIADFVKHYGLKRFEDFLRHKNLI